MTTRAQAGRRGARWRLVGWGGAAALMLVPVVARFPWTALDYIFMAVMLGGFGIAFELAVRRRDAMYRVGAGAALGAAFLLIWVNAAVGMIGSEGNPYNLLFGGVLAALLVGAIVGRFEPAGMARATLAAAVVQVAVAAGGLSADGRGALLSMVVAAPWLVAAAAFRQAARRSTRG